jgi:hypothetical protein
MTMASQADSDSVELLRVGESMAPLVVSLITFKGVRYLDIRRYYFDKTSKTTKPTPKGLALKEDEFLSVIGFLSGEFEELKKLFTNNLVPEEMNARAQRKESLARKKIKNDITDMHTSFEKWRGPNFFLADISKKKIELKFNDQNKVIAQIKEDELSGSQVLEKLLHSYALAKKSIDSPAKITPDATLDYLEVAWNNFLR